MGVAGRKRRQGPAKGYAAKRVTESVRVGAACTSGQLFLSRSHFAPSDVLRLFVRIMTSGRLIHMRTFMRTMLLLAMLLAAGSALNAQVSIGVGIAISAPPPPRVVVVMPASPGPDYLWVEGYWYPVGNHYRWHEGYWTRPPYEGAHWVSPRYDRERYFGGHWEGFRGRVEHDHDRDRDFHRYDRDDHHDHDDR